MNFEFLFEYVSFPCHRGLYLEQFHVVMCCFTVASCLSRSAHDSLFEAVLYATIYLPCLRSQLTFVHYSYCPSNVVVRSHVKVANKPRYDLWYMQDIGAAWKTLENAEKGFEEWLLSEMQRFVHVSSLVTHLTMQ